MGKQKKNELSEKNWIVKSNTLNEIRNSQMTISQIRLFTIYLSKINPSDIKSREVTFTLNEYAKIMQFKQTNITRLKESAEDMLKVIITFWGEQKEGEKYREFTSCQLFKRIKLHQNNENEWTLSIDCHDDILHLMFELKKHFFKYQLWNALQLVSTNQQRMYEILKQYEYAGAREISVKDLREFLGIKPEEYPRWERFKTRILDASQVALANYTDIKFRWEAVRGRGKGGKINSIKFYIEKNDDYIRQLTFDDYITEQDETEVTDDIKEFESTNNSVYSFLSEACNNEFSLEEIALLHSLIIKIVPHSSRWDLDMYDYLHGKYAELNWRSTQKSIKNRFSYLKKIIESP